jgi:hypothetical protein
MQQRAGGVEDMATAPVAASDLREVRHCSACGAPLISVPMLHCRCGQEHPLRCFTYQRGPLHFAECLDLDLLAQGDTVEEAIGKLQEAVYGYLVVAFDGDSCRALVPRPAPATHWVRYFFHWLRTVPERLRLGRHLSGGAQGNCGARPLSHCGPAL